MFEEPPQDKGIYRGETINAAPVHGAINVPTRHAYPRTEETPINALETLRVQMLSEIDRKSDASNPAAQNSMRCSS